MKSNVYVYGSDAGEIQDGDKFVAKVKSVEGRKVVVLEPVIRAGSVRGEPL